MDIEILRIGLRMLDALRHTIEQEITARVSKLEPQKPVVTGKTYEGESLKDVKNHWFQATGMPLRADETGQVAKDGEDLDRPISLTVAEYKRLMIIADWVEMQMNEGRPSPHRVPTNVPGIFIAPPPPDYSGGNQ